MCLALDHRTPSLEARGPESGSTAHGSGRITDQFPPKGPKGRGWHAFNFRETGRAVVVDGVVDLHYGRAESRVYSTALFQQ